MWDLGLDSGPKKGLEWENWRNWTSLNSVSSDGGSVVINVLGLRKTLTMQEKEWGQEGAPWADLWNFPVNLNLLQRKRLLEKNQQGAHKHS